MTTHLFAGDSVTDCGRTFFDPDVAAGALGDGWVRVLAALLGHRHPGRHRFLNAGVSGDRVADLDARWERDVVAHSPAVLTVLIGVNDAWQQPPTRLDEVERSYRAILERVPPSVDVLVLADPFVVPATAEAAALREPVEAIAALVEALAGEVGALHLPLARRLAEACDQAPAEWWATDGIHPTAAGHGLIAEAWLTDVCAAISATTAEK